MGNGFPSCKTSNYAVLLVPGDKMIFYEPVEEVSWSTNEVSIMLRPEEDRDLAFLRSIHARQQVVVAYVYDVAICEVTENSLLAKQGVTRCRLALRVQKSDFWPSMEVGFSSTSADELAKFRTRRLLLNESPRGESTDINAITRELFLAGMDTLVRVERSPFPTLFQQFSATPQRFLQIAWIVAVLQLKLSACVSEIEFLELALQGTALEVRFAGKRKRKYQDMPPYEIRVEGMCHLTSSTRE